MNLKSYVYMSVLSNKVIYKSLMMMKTIKYQVKLFKMVWHGWNEVLPMPHHFTIYYIYIYIYIYIHAYIHILKRERES